MDKTPQEHVAEGAELVTDEDEPLVTKTGKVLTDADIEELADEAEAGYDVEHLRNQPSRREMTDIEFESRYGRARAGMTRRHETSHTETWEITFRATVPAGLAARGALETAEGIIRQRMTEVLNQAGVADPRVQARKVGRSTHRGDWEGGVEYEPGETVFEAGKLWMSNKRSQNRPPHSNHGGIVDYWAETSHIFLADELFLPQPRKALVESTNKAGDPIMSVVDADDVVVDAELIE